MESLNQKDIANLKERLERLENKVDEGFSHLSAKLEILIDGYVKRDELDKYVTKESFFPVKSIAYGAVGIILIAVFSALVYLVVQK